MLSGRDSRTLNLDINVAIRHGFIRKVYGIVGTQLLLTAVVAVAIVSAGAEYLRENQSFTLGLLLFSSLTSIATMCIFCCAPHLMRRSPVNYGILFFFTLAEAIAVGLLSAQYTKASVILALGVTSVVVFGLTLFAWQTRWDFTGMGPYLFVGMLCLCAFGFFMWLGSFFLSGESWHFLNLVYAIGGAFLVSCYLIYDTQLIVGGKHHRSHEFSVDDYAFAAITLYLDIVQLFMWLLRILGQRRD
eukprot:TRINITY_DN24242_c0_g1_i1.p1 TRINITY_DN24242_c0_g1~~TRINITY_DN24242_c0_g1_i1.p1  ORF type:complete len:245 (+),score=34.40 TRINITY_DN24242_c0_g1_i1:98-832(+)